MFESQVQLSSDEYYAVMQAGRVTSTITKDMIVHFVRIAVFGKIRKRPIFPA